MDKLEYIPGDLVMTNGVSGTLDEGFDEEAYAINRQFKSFKRRYLKAKENKK